MQEASTPKAVQDCHLLLEWLIPLLDSFPRVRRFTLGQTALNCRKRRPFFLFLLWSVLALNSVAQEAGQSAAQTPAQARAVAPQPLMLEPQPPCVVDPERGPQMVVIPGGDLKMGSPAEEAGRHDDESPQHEVKIQPFALGRCEVTVAEFRVFVEASGYQTEAERPAKDDQPEGPTKGCYSINIEKLKFQIVAGKNWRDPGFAQGEQSPVTCVSWNDTRAYIDWLNRRSGARYRLPTEAEWEYAARAGTSTRYSFGDDVDTREQCDYANGADQSVKQQLLSRTDTDFVVADCDDAYVYTAPVGLYKPNAWGLYDMHGNVWEWVEDCWHESYANAPVDGSAWLEANNGECDRRVVRGGSWGNEPANLRSAIRGRNVRDVRYVYLGFRLARTLD